jgi:hypothetical protein
MKHLETKNNKLRNTNIILKGELSSCEEEASATLINMHFLYVLGVRIFEKEDQYIKLVEPFLCMD